MKTLIALALVASLTGCSTIMNDRIQDVDVTSPVKGTPYVVTNQAGERVHSGVTPERIKLDAAAGVFDGETYQVNGVELDSKVTGWYWVGFCITVFSGLLVDPLTGDMFELPDSVQL